MKNKSVLKMIIKRKIYITGGEYDSTRSSWNDDLPFLTLSEVLCSKFFK